MASLSLPLLVLGKAAESGRMPSSYGILCRHPDFDEGALEAVHKIRNGFEWVARPGEVVHESCFGVWPLAPSSERALLLRLTDQGRDDQGRPHCLRIDAVLITDAEVLRSSTALAGLLQPAAWLSTEPRADAASLAELQMQQPEPGLARALPFTPSGQLAAAFLTGVSGTFRNQAFDVAHETRRAAAEGAGRPPRAAREPASSRAEPDASGQAGPARWRGTLAGLAIGLALGMLGGLLLRQSEVARLRSGLESARTDLLAQTENSRTLAAELLAANRKLDSALTQAKASLAAWEEVAREQGVADAAGLGRLVREQRQFLERLKEGADRALGEQNQRLERENAGLKSQLRQLSDLLLKIRELTGQEPGVSDPP
jgi:hypothetical protein